MFHPFSKLIEGATRSSFTDVFVLKPLPRVFLAGDLWDMETPFVEVVVCISKAF